MTNMNSSPPMPAKRYDLEERTATFADRVRTFLQKVPYSLSNAEDKKQLIRSSGSVASNYLEANECLGRGDFIMRARISLKESKESRLWLSLLQIPVHMTVLEQERQFLRNEADEFVKIFCTILKRVREKWNRKKYPDSRS